ncbi:MAG: GDP-mannose 4,6-dehydratase [Parcubacteria group bacterium]|jgi:CDP-glucose 4,6-dehydratase
MKKFWNNKKVLITGGGGFIGSNLSDRLISMGAKVYSLEKNSSKKAFLEKSSLPNKTIIQGDICNKKFIDNLFKKEDFEICFHLAARPLVLEGRANEAPLETFKVNIMGTLNILEAVRNYKTRGLIMASTSHVYGKNKLPFLEEYFPRPSSPYETSKACADILAQTYKEHYKLPVAIARFVNVYGPGDYNQRIIPKTIQLVLKNESPQLYDNIAKRSYLYIDDAVDGYIYLAEKINELVKNRSNIIYNFGTEEVYSTKNIIENILFLMKSDIKPIIIKGARDKEIASQYVSIKKSKEILQWNPKVSIVEGLKNTIKWHKLKK